MLRNLTVTSNFKHSTNRRQVATIVSNISKFLHESFQNLHKYIFYFIKNIKTVQSRIFELVDHKSVSDQLIRFIENRSNSE